MGVVPIGGRSTAIKLSSGQVWVLASTPMTDETKETIDRMGPVRYAGLVIFIALENDFSEDGLWRATSYTICTLENSRKSIQTPRSLVWKGYRRRISRLTEVREFLLEKALDSIVALAYGVDPPDTKYGFEDEV
jgi:hypothetical protein